MNEDSKITGFSWLKLSLYAFLFLCIEAIYAFLLEPFIWNREMTEWSTGQIIFHWVLTCVTWWSGSCFLIRYSKRKYHFDIWENKGSIKLWQWLTAILCVIFTFTVHYLDWNGFKAIIEFQNNGILKFIFQYLYYFFETILFTLIIIFGQKAFECWFKKGNIPYGGFVVALTWGLGHWLSKGSLYTGVLSAIAGFCFGVVYLLLNRNIKWTYVFLLFMFIF